MEIVSVVKTLGDMDANKFFAIKYFIYTNKCAVTGKTRLLGLPTISSFYVDTFPRKTIIVITHQVTYHHIEKTLHWVMSQT